MCLIFISKKNIFIIFQLKINLKLEDCMKRHLVCEIVESDLSSELSDELVSCGLINTVLISNIIMNTVNYVLLSALSINIMIIQFICLERP